MPQEQISLKRMFDFSPLAIIKSFAIVLKIVVVLLFIILICGGIYNFYNMLFPKPVSNVNQPTFNVAQGATVEYSNVQNDEKLNEIGIVAGPIYLDEEVGGFVGIQFSRRF